MKLLITGASGFIGSHLVKHFSNVGHEVTAFCRTPRKIESLTHANVRVVQGLIEDFPLVEGLVKNQDAVIHCALPGESRPWFPRLSLCSIVPPNM